MSSQAPLACCKDWKTEKWEGPNYQGRASGGREMVELGHPPGNETARSILRKMVGNLNFKDWTIKWEGNLISSSIRRHVRLFIPIFFHFFVHKTPTQTIVECKALNVKSGLCPEYSWRFHRFCWQDLRCLTCEGHIPSQTRPRAPKIGPDILSHA